MSSLSTSSANPNTFGWRLGVIAFPQAYLYRRIIEVYLFFDSHKELDVEPLDPPVRYLPRLQLQPLSSTTLASFGIVCLSATYPQCLLLRAASITE